MLNISFSCLWSDYGCRMAYTTKLIQLHYHLAKIDKHKVKPIIHVGIYSNDNVTSRRDAFSSAWVSFSFIYI